MLGLLRRIPLGAGEDSGWSLRELVSLSGVYSFIESSGVLGSHKIDYRISSPESGKDK